jgi:hypothetical protein
MPLAKASVKSLVEDEKAVRWKNSFSGLYLSLEVNVFPIYTAILSEYDVEA